MITHAISSSFLLAMVENSFLAMGKNKKDDDEELCANVLVDSSPTCKL